jgi:hypothetical protein
MADLLLDDDNSNNNAIDILEEVIYHLEEATLRHHPFATFNLGIAYTFGYGVKRNTTVAREWFVLSGLPEGVYFAAHQAKSVGDIPLFEQLLDQAHTMGYGTPWRKQVRVETGSGGCGGVDLNLPWPVAANGKLPPKV